MILTPGAYIQLRRMAAGLAVEDVAHAIATVPGISEDRRAEWLRLIEADDVPMLWSTIVALRRVIPIDLTVLEQLSLITDGADIRPILMCEGCGETHPACLALGAARGAGPGPMCLECASVAQGHVA